MLRRLPETMNLPIFYRIGARGPRTASLFFPFFCVRSRYWHLASFSERERERDEVRKWIEENVRAGNRRRQNLSSLPPPPPPNSQLLRRCVAVGYFTCEAKGTPPSLPSFHPFFPRPSPNPISNFGFSKFFRARNQSTN